MADGWDPGLPTALVTHINYSYVFLSLPWGLGSNCIFVNRAMSMTTEFTFLSWNVRGLGDGVKHTALFSALKPYKSAIVFTRNTLTKRHHSTTKV